MIHLVLGGARSGKTRFATSSAAELEAKGFECVYIATAQALDDEMSERIARHQQERQTSSSTWLTVESPYQLVDTLKEHASDKKVLVVDCLTLWLTNHLLLEDNSTVFSHQERKWCDEKMTLLAELSTLPGEIYLVSNEVGCGIVPLGEINRRFVDESGWLHQDIAAIADTVTLVTAGIPMKLKG